MARPRKNERGYAILMVLLMGTAIFLILTAAIRAQLMLRQQNRRAKQNLQEKCDALELKITPTDE